MKLNNPVPDYTIILQHYSSRIFSDQGDVISAMLGIMRRLSYRMDCTFFQGIPVATFDIFLLFHGSMLKRRKIFPSYSWAGWIGQITYHERTTIQSGATNFWLRRRTWIVWYERTPAGEVNLLSDLVEKEALAELSEFQVDHDMSSSDGARPLNTSTFQAEPVKGAQFERSVPDYAMLQFWTIAVFYRIDSFDVMEGIANLSDKSGKRCGTLRMDSFEEDDYFNLGSIYEFILLARSYGDYCNQCQRHEGSLFYIMIIEWCGGFAERRGLGELCHTAIETSLQPGPIWKHIFLA